jgi:YD repeat-containing protein
MIAKNKKGENVPISKRIRKERNIESKRNRTIFLIAVILIATSSIATGQTFRYSYDAAGNRETRTINLSNMMSPNNNNDSTGNYEILYNEIIEDMVEERNIEEENPLLSNTTNEDNSETTEKKLETNKIPIEIEVHPNPVQEKLYLTINGLGENSGYFTIFDFNGKLIKRQEIRSKESAIDFSQSPPGTYLLIIHVGQQTQTYKIVRTK